MKVYHGSVAKHFVTMPNFAAFRSNPARNTCTATKFLQSQSQLTRNIQSCNTSRFFRFFCTQITNSNREPNLLDSYSNIRQLLDSARAYMPDHSYLRTVKQLIPLLEVRKIKLSDRQYWLVFRFLAQTRTFSLAKSLLSCYKRDYGTPSPLIYDKLFELEGKQGWENLLAAVEEAKQNNVPFDIKMHTTVLKGIATQGNLQVLRDYMNQIKQAEYQLDVIVYSVYLEGLMKHGSIDHVLEGLKEMQQHNITPNSIVLNGILKNLVFHNKTSSILDNFLELAKSIPPNTRSFEILLLHASNIDQTYFNTIWNLVSSFNITHTESMFNSRIYLASRKGDISEMVKAFTEMQSAGLQPNRLTYAFLIEGYITVGAAQEVMSLFGNIGRPTPRTVRNVVHFLKQRGEYEQANKIAEQHKRSQPWLQNQPPITGSSLKEEDKELLNDLEAQSRQNKNSEQKRKIFPVGKIQNIMRFDEN